MIHPIVDAFYSPNPAHERSAGFAQAKGQTVTGPDKQVLSRDEGTGGVGRVEGDVVTQAIRRLAVH
jgi:glutamine amidotransferase